MLTDSVCLASALRPGMTLPSILTLSESPAPDGVYTVHAVSGPAHERRIEFLDEFGSIHARTYASIFAALFVF